MKKLLLSIIIPVYNVQEYLEECLNSVLSQKLDNFEVICVNDGSTDNSSNILERYKTKYSYLTVIDQKNSGLSAARNSGLKVASGKYIYFLDSDDYLLPNVLKTMITFVEKHKLDLALFNVLKDGKELYFNIKNVLKGVYTGIEFCKLNYEYNGFFPPCSVWMHIFRRELLEINCIKFLEGIVHEDEEFTPRIYYLASRVGILDIPILYHRIMRTGSITEATLIHMKEQNLRDIVVTSSELYYFFKVNRCTEDIFYHKVFQNYLSIAVRISEKKPELKNNIFHSNDFKIMRMCSISWDWYIYYWLFKYNIELFKRYRSHDTSVFLKKCINTLFKVFFTLFHGKIVKFTFN